MECPSCEHPNVDNASYCAKCGLPLPAQQTDDTDKMLGVVIKNTFRVVRLLGEGGMGRVYEVEQQMGTTTRKVAVKTLHPHLSQDPQIVARFSRECGTVATLEHPNTIQFFDFGQAPDGSLFIAMEFIDGKSICDLLEKEGPVSPARVEHIMRQVCGSLAEAHKKGIVHRDLKPDNIVLTTRAGEEDFAKVLDFGIAARTEAADAKKEQKLTQQGMVLGTPPYMSPEQFTGKQLDGRSDIYSLGVMVYEMLTGKLPFDADTPWEWATKHLTGQPYPFERGDVAINAPIPAGMKLAIMRALEKDPNARQADVTAFFEEFSSKDASQPYIASAASGGPVRTELAMPAAFAGPPQEAYPQAPGYAAPPVVAAPMPIPMNAYTSPPAKSGGGMKVVLMVLAAVVVVGLCVGVIVWVRGNTDKHGEEQDVLVLPPPTATAPATTVSPFETPPPVDTATAPPSTTYTPPPPPPPPVYTPPAGTPKPPATPATPTTTAIPTTTTPPATATPTKTTSPVRLPPRK